jgi:2-polyprenyl-3-methyl-5-hydroxy-6-metoxy-1,4-benzoquinol methylase
MAQYVGRGFSKQRLRPIRRAQILRLVEDWPCGRVLDAPAGSLWLARALAARRFEVDAFDLLAHDSDLATAGVIRYMRGNLDEGLPQFADRTFDYVVCVEGLEHLEHPALLLREFGRVLKPRGRLLVTTPNIVSLRSRLKFLLFGYYDGFRRRTLFRRIGMPPDHETPHITPLHPQFLYYWLTGAGFTHIRAQDLRVRHLERWVLLPLAMLIAGLGQAAGRASGEPHYAEYLTLLVSWPVLFSPTLILTAQRADPSRETTAGTVQRAVDTSAPLEPIVWRTRS